MYAVREAPVGYGRNARVEPLWLDGSFATPAYGGRAREDHAPVLAALYLAGAPRGLESPRRNASEILRVLRCEDVGLGGAARALARFGFSREALALESPGLLSWAEQQVAGDSVLTLADQEYPRGWRRKLSVSAPPALWRRGPMPSGRVLAVVGSREVPTEVRTFARKAGFACRHLGYSLVSGGAAGCDQAAALGAAGFSEDSSSRGEVDASGVVEILPFGLARSSPEPSGALLSLFEPAAEFSGPQAMQRNTLIYAMAEAAIVVQARFGVGGTWQGAIEARRRRHCGFIVGSVCEERARRALVALGAVDLESPGDLDGAISALEESSRGALFPDLPM